MSDERRADGGEDGDDIDDGAATVRPARPDETERVRRLLDAAMLEVPADLPDRVAAGDVLVRTVPDAGENRRENERNSRRVIGTLVLDGNDLRAVAVARSRRARGHATALVRAAARRTDGPLVATFRPSVAPFYEALGFDVRALAPADPDTDRLVGRLDGDPDVTE